MSYEIIEGKVYSTKESFARFHAKFGKDTKICIDDNRKLYVEKYGRRFYISFDNMKILTRAGITVFLSPHSHDYTCDQEFCPKSSIIGTTSFDKVYYAYYPRKFGREAVHIVVFCDNTKVWEGAKKFASENEKNSVVKEGINFQLKPLFGQKNIKMEGEMGHIKTEGVDGKIYYVFTFFK